MAGFARIAVVGNVDGIEVVNVFWYRSETLLPFAQGPFEEMQNVLDAFVAHISTEWAAAHTANYVWQRADGLGYTDGMVPIDGSQATNTVQEPGVHAGVGMDSYAHVANITWICGTQHQITGLGNSQRNRGRTAIGPVSSSDIADDGHFTGNYISAIIDALANKLRGTFIVPSDFADAIPIRLHKAVSLGITTGTTYSDILGYKLPTKTGYQRSRLPEV